eukprot:10731513-Karenia_brevis.AAC.1
MASGLPNDTITGSATLPTGGAGSLNGGGSGGTSSVLCFFGAGASAVSGGVDLATLLDDGPAPVAGISTSMVPKSRC